VLKTRIRSGKSITAKQKERGVNLAPFSDEEVELEQLELYRQVLLRILSEIVEEFHALRR
jgi:hypothetical protein